MTGRTTIADNLVKTKIFIDKDGNKIVGPTARGWDTTVLEYAQNENLDNPTAPVETVTQEQHEAEQKALDKPVSPIAEAIKKQVQIAVQEAIKDIDIKGMVQEAMKEAFK